MGGGWWLERERPDDRPWWERGVWPAVFTIVALTLIALLVTMAV
jgi:hypothetical protein